MREEYKNKEIARCDRVIASYQEDIVALEKGIEDLKEKYKNVFDEIEETNEIIGYYRESQQQWIDKKRILNGEEPAEVAEEPIRKSRKKREKKEEVPAAPANADKVIDTIYPENNEPEEVVVTEEVVPQEEAPKEDAATDTLFSDVWPEDNIQDEAVVEEKEEEAEHVLEDPFDSEEDFPDVFEEWK